jgi:cob(I)alamin adenosyltransferase
MEGNIMELKSCINDAQCAGREPNIREKLDGIYDFISNCCEMVATIDGRLYSPIPQNPTSGVSGNIQTVEDKLQAIYNKVINMHDSLKYINDRL